MEYDEPIFDKKDAQIIVDNLYGIYYGDEYMTKRLNNFFKNQIWTMFDNINQMHIQRKTYAIEMTMEQEDFIKSFISKNKYYYVASTDRFILYDEFHYVCVSEDDILHHVLTEISKYRTLMAWKQRTKINIMKRIRETSIFRTIPNSETIQKVLDAFCPLLFSTKTEVKYFLSILGDNLQKKSQSLIHLVPNKAKPFIRELDNYAQICLGAHISSTFKYKYHEHDYSNCRILNIMDNVQYESQWSDFLKNNALDVLCVGIHYSMRYESSDQFLSERNMDKQIEDNILFLKMHTQEDIVTEFMSEYITPSTAFGNEEDTTISWKTMQYLWKHFLDMRRLPAIIFQSNLKQLIIKKWQNSLRTYDESSDIFVGAFSKYIPSIRYFLQFWTDYMVYDINEYDLEIDEIVTLFRMYRKSKDLNEKQVLDLISYFYPNVEIENNKYVQKWRCKLWDKGEDIMSVVMDAQSAGESMYNLYETYCQKKYAEHLPVVSKQYFEKYLTVYFEKVCFYTAAKEKL